MKRDYRLYVVIAALILIPVTVVIVLWQIGYFNKAPSSPSAPATGTNPTGYTCNGVDNLRGSYNSSRQTIELTFGSLPAPCAGLTPINIQTNNVVQTYMYTLSAGMTSIEIPAQFTTPGIYIAHVSILNSYTNVYYSVK